MTTQLNGTTSVITLPTTPASTDNSLTAVDSAFVQSRVAQYGSHAGFRNLVHNGDFKIAQRGTSGALTSTVSYLSLDRWAATQLGTANGVLAQVTAGLTGFQYAAKIGRNSGAVTTGNIYAQQAFETINSVPYQGQTVTLSFYAKAGANYSGGALTSSVYTGTGTDQAVSSMGSWTGVATPLTSGFTLTTSWQRFTIMGTIASTATQIGISFNWTPTGTAGADDNVYITGVQLEQGSLASPFEYRPIGAELDLCLRYYQALGGITMFRTVASGNYNGGLTSGSIFPMRVAPTYVLTVNASDYNAPSFSVGQSTYYLAFLNSDGVVGRYAAYSVTLSADL